MFCENLWGYVPNILHGRGIEYSAANVFQEKIVFLHERRIFEIAIRIVLVWWQMFDAFTKINIKRAMQNLSKHRRTTAAQGKNDNSHPWLALPFGFRDSLISIFLFL